MACGPNCNCKQHGRGSGTASVGFAFGVALGAAAGAVLAADPKTRKQAKRKLDALVGDAAPEVVESVKEVAAQVIEDIRGQLDEDEPASKPRKRKPARKRAAA